MATGVGYRLYRLSLAELAPWVVASLVLAFLVLPLLVIIPISFSSGAFLTFPPPGFSLRWYQVLASEEPWRRAFQNSLIAGAAATVIATVLGTLAALGIARLSFRGKSLLTAVLISPMIVPVIIVGTGVYFFFSPLGLTGSLLGLALAHAALGAPFVLITVSASLAGFPARRSRR